MKSSYDSAIHQKIREQKEKDQEVARSIINGKKEHPYMTQDKVFRILTDDLTGGERRDRRMRAGVITPKQVMKQNEVIEQKEFSLEDMAQLGLRELGEKLSVLGNMTVRVEKSENSGLEFFVSIPGCAIYNVLIKDPGKWREEARGDSIEDAVSSYFRHAQFASFITKQEGGTITKYRWSSEKQVFVQKGTGPLFIEMIKRRIRRKKAVKEIKN